MELVAHTGLSAPRIRPADLVGVAVLAVVWFLLMQAPDRYGNDALSYWQAWRGPLYDAAWGSRESFVYSPAFGMAIWPLTLLPWEAFFAIWTGLELVVLALLLGPLAAAIVVASVQPVFQIVGEGNVDLMIGLAIALGFRYPAAWAFVLLSKITPGVGLAWFAVRREWRALAIALGVTVALSAISALVAPHLWIEWFGLLSEARGRDTEGVYLVIWWPLWARLLLGLGIVVWAARTDRRWLLPVAAFVASPLPSPSHMSLMLGALPLLGWGPLRR